MESFLYTLAFAAISTAAWMAFREPRLYRYLYSPTMFVIYAVFFSCVLWDVSAMHTSGAARDAVYELPDSVPKIDVATAIDQKIDSKRLPMETVIFVTIALSLYLGFLLELPNIRKALGPNQGDAGAEKS